MPVTNKNHSAEYCEKNNVKLVRGGKEYFDLLLQLIDRAEESIHLQAYIFDNDETGVMVGEALKKAAARNIAVHVMADGYASQVISRRYINELKDTGIHFRFFEPLFKSKYFYFGRRLHHKVFVVDAKYALVGGINIADRYNDLPGEPAWLDFSIYAEGMIAKELCVLCWKTWNDFPKHMGITPCEEKQIDYSWLAQPFSKVRMRRNDWVRRKNEISATYIQMLWEAESHITIVCSYFLPGRVIRRLMKSAVKRGVKIKVITAGHSDVVLSKHAERWLYDWLLRHQVEIYEYQPNVLHSKLAVCDSGWMTVGSYNVNDISAYASIELNLDVLDSPFTKKTEHLLDSIIRDSCIKIDRDTHHRNTNLFIRFIRWLAYFFFRVAFTTITFYYKRRVN